MSNQPGMSQQDVESNSSQRLAPPSSNNLNEHASKKRSVVLHKDASPSKIRDEETTIEKLQQSSGLINADIVKDLREQREI